MACVKLGHNQKGVVHLQSEGRFVYVELCFRNLFYVLTSGHHFIRGLVLCFLSSHILLERTGEVPTVSQIRSIVVYAKENSPTTDDVKYSSIISLIAILLNCSAVFKRFIPQLSTAAEPRQEA